MDYQLNVPAILRRAEQLFGHKEIVTRIPDKSFHRYTYADFVPALEAARAGAPQSLGLEDGDRVGDVRVEPLPAPRGVLGRCRPAGS